MESNIINKYKLLILSIGVFTFGLFNLIIVKLDKFIKI